MDIKFQELETKQLVVGDYVVSKTKKIGLVIRKGKTWLHEHPFIKVKWFWYKLSGYIMTETETYFEHENLSTNKIYLEDSKKKKG